MAKERIYSEQAMDALYPVKVIKVKKDKALAYCKVNKIDLATEIRILMDSYADKYDKDTLKGLNDGDYTRR